MDSSSRPFGIKRAAEILVGFGVVGLEGDGRPISGDGFVDPSAVLQRDAEVFVNFRMIGPDDDGLAETLHCGLMPAGLPGDDSEQMQRIRVTWLGGQDLR